MRLVAARMPFHLEGQAATLPECADPCCFSRKQCGVEGRIRTAVTKQPDLQFHGGLVTGSTAKVRQGSQGYAGWQKEE